ncbi:hypothetical protein ERX37_09005 [Macrococcus hajekii]|uniref:Uncharacterized protein n=1 Tax=Macrococcus hajekii TaxID=198482 RepID=A0A4R6BJC7_9STAP|nr:hypothetical protein [Macrococcus hajekii]TDM01621.1 hypothetical protein ERX37_09005 [Macrococcus hajekii]GGB01571.1 hypothetical protein GCM10007190_07040 [Macrococcus hajekii]
MAHFDGWKIKNETHYPDDKIAKLEDSIIVTDEVSMEDGTLSIEEIGSVTATESNGDVKYEETESDVIYFVIDDEAQTVIIKES